ncbi:pseudaminic acid biosynthesis protein PseG [Pseudoalteromonas sp. MMG022]|uniref:pseudaminic acid biosynthesis protein PseG n=1 Tax=Pseudoalteromonas sp. MMG022 TaxID=2909978 RepID=UPI001F33710D|nr:pseudaminic acid biosynthesis protein PseG [Pseudoalteromonas sp. MMG022]MCF6434700.1 pseudaminic acid biosynthesis protein PseG [Pseudoalteromonas sp. MMG022]
MIAFRIDSLSGLGHFMRSKWLALALKEQGVACKLFLDNQPNKELCEPFCQDVVIVPRGLTQVQQASWCTQYLSEQGLTPSHWVIDGYKFSMQWELAVKSPQVGVVVIDDLARSHEADWVIDAKWQGHQTFSRYDDRVSEDTQLLLGPEYALLSPQYAQFKPQLQRQNSLLFSLGGGGDWSRLTELISHLLHQDNGLLKIEVIIGPYATSTEELSQLAEKFANLHLITGENSLYHYYVQCGLFVGALGTSLYELAATQTSAVTFSIADNQHNDQQDLEQLGHYFHIPDLLDYPVNEIASTLHALLQYRERLNKLAQSAAVKVDGLGAQRVCSVLLNNHHSQKQVLPKASYEETSIQITPDLTLRPVQDTDINHYLNARNRADNAWRMTITKQISQLQHYRWWFANQRASFVLESEGGALLYIWHQLFEIRGQQYLIGGWFAASDDVGFAHAQLILDWQLKETAKLWPKAHWLAVINKENKFVNLLNQRAGFVAVAEGSPEFESILALFPDATPEQFNFVAKFADNNT